MLRPLLALLLLTPAAHAASIRTIAGTGIAGFSGDGGPAAKAQFNSPSAMALGPDGSLYLSDSSNNRIRRIAPDGTVSTVAGIGTAGESGDGKPALQAQLNDPWDMAFDPQGGLVWVERLGQVIRRLDMKTGTLSTLAGTGQLGFSGDGGPATRAQLNQPHGLAFDHEGNLYLTDIHNHRLRRIDHATGVITTLAGTGERKPTPEGAKALGTPISGPRAVAVDAEDRIWILLRDGHALLRLERDGTLTHVIGTGTKGNSGDLGDPAQAHVSGPKAFALEPNGDVILADSDNNAVRLLTDHGKTLRTLVSKVAPPDHPDEAVVLCPLKGPCGVLPEPSGKILIADSGNHLIREYDPN